MDYTLPVDCDPLITEITSYWSSLSDDARLPDRTQLDPAQFPEHLPGVALMDVSHNPWRFRFRLLGEEIVLHHGSNLTGEWMHVAFPHFDKTKTKADMIETVETGQPVYRKGRPLMTYEKSFVEIERVMLPFRNGGESAEMIFIYSILR